MDFGISVRSHESGAAISGLRSAASHGHFAHHRVALCACRNRLAHKIAADREGDSHCAFGRTGLELCHLLNFYSQPRSGGLAADVADANVRLGDGGGDRSDVDRKSALV